MLALMRFCGKGRSYSFSTSAWQANKNLAQKELTSIKSPSPSSSPDSKNSLAKDVILFRYENPKFFKFLNVFAITQFGFWMFLSSTSFTMVDIPVRQTPKSTELTVQPKVEEKEEDLPFWRKINLGSDKYKYGLGIGSFLMGYGILAVSWMYTLRSVRFLILRKDRLKVAFVTYGPFGKNRIMDVPLDCISAAGSRGAGTSQMPVKVKGKWLFYMLDLKEGHFPQAKLFDQTVGIQRKFKR